jgi:uncharacterized protein YjbI with pentapeptide repeats
MLKSHYGEVRIPFTQGKLSAALAEHERYVLRRGGKRALLAHSDLSGLNLANRMLNEAVFSGASLVGATMFGSNLERASLYCADLRDCNLQSARLNRADMRGASFRGANLARAVLDHADLRAGMMMLIGPDGCAVVDGGTASDGEDTASGGVDFSNCSLKNVSFGNVKLDKANFDGALLNGANFKGAKLSNVTFNGAVLTGVDVKDLGVPPRVLANCITDVGEAALAKVGELKARIDAHHAWIASNGKNGRPANLDGEDLRPLEGFLTGRSLGGMSCRKAIAIGIDFSNCQLQAAHFDGADLRDCNFASADLRGASFKSARLAHARFTKANMRGLALATGAQKETDFAGADAVRDQFFDALSDRDVLEPAAVLL